MELIQGVYLCGNGVFGLTSDGDCHCYMLDEGSELALIDCGPPENPETTPSRLEEDGLDTGRPRYLLLTHSHPDHTNGCAWPQRNLGIQVLANVFGAQVLERGLLEALGLNVDNESYRQSAVARRCKVDYVIEDNEMTGVRASGVRVLLIPGHTARSTSYETEMNGGRQLFTGDEAFCQGSVNILTVPLFNFKCYHMGPKRLEGRGVDGLFPAHFTWTLKNGQKHISKALWDFEAPRHPNLKLFS